MIQLEGVSVTYPGGVQALKPTDLSFRRGEIAVLLGTSGAGKSTLLRSINRLVEPTLTIEGGELAKDLLIIRHTEQPPGGLASRFAAHLLDAQV